ncbi:MAG: Gldg family protein [Myxococcales bacterium]|nr:Gldg family protein [Myxococcales bacterium]
MRALRAAYWVWRRELHVMLRAPILYVIGGVFLVVQGIAFAGLVGALSDPRRPAPLGALLEGQLAGTLLTWVLELVVLTLLGMRTIAEDKRSGGWELLLTAQVGEGAAVIGKWLAAATLYTLLWIPTLAYLGVVAWYRADDGGWDLATIATGYAGAIAIGAALLAWAIAASAAMTSTLGAGALGFALLIGLFLLGELPGLWPTFAIDHPQLAVILRACSVRETAGAFARGEITLASLVLIAGVTVLGLSAAITLACAGRRRRREIWLRALGTVLVAASCVLAGGLALVHPMTWDASAGRRNSLDPDTREVLAALPPGAALTIVQPTLGGLEPIYDEVERVTARFSAAAPDLVVRTVDPANAPGGLLAVARSAGLQPGDLAQGGAIVVDVAGRRRVVDLLAIATLERGVDGAPRVERLAIEQAIAGALAALIAPVTIHVCVTAGHGELPFDVKDDKGADWTLVADRLRAEGMTIESVPLDDLARCTVVVIAGPAIPLRDVEALALQGYVRGGGVLIAAAASRTLDGSLGRLGIEAVLDADGLAIPAAIVVDPSLTVRELPGALLISEGYADHPINAGFRGARPTLWFQPRAVVTGKGAIPLVTASAASWGERDLLHAPPARDGDDLAGPVAVAALGASKRVLAIGSAESLSSAVLAGGASAGDLWLAHAIRFLAGGHEPVIAAPATAPTQVRLVMTSAQRTSVLAVCVGLIPLAWVLIGGALVIWRRRRAA